jgi:hypothetical protein
METSVVVVAWLLGSVCGALWLNALEQEDRTEKARLYSRLMIFFYLWGPLTLILLGIAQRVGLFL